ncbi:unnamed protein product [Caenorhabditis bovis]|uniref:Atos-like conserved domain-containing protein n=1 Tax=Caenorhabditis bovis TaxID=2654633 RepID=A0A8S1F9M4_9PELO|nr:unnamed protein product [Caenorhabditis bovis]
MVSDEKDGQLKRKTNEDETRGSNPKRAREMEPGPSTLLQRLSCGDLDGVDGIDESHARLRNRTHSEFAPTRVSLDSTTPPTTKSALPTRLRRRNLSTSEVVNRSLLGNFTESALNGRLDPVTVLDGFSLQMVASSPTYTGPHQTLPITVYFFDLNTTGDAFFSSAPVPYLGRCELGHEYRIPRRGQIQCVLFNPQRTVVKMFLTPYDVEDMPPNAKTFIRHVWHWHVANQIGAPKHLQYLIHYRLASDRRNRVYLHTDIRILFAQDSARDALLLPIDGDGTPGYCIRDRVEMPTNPKYSQAK